MITRFHPLFGAAMLLALAFSAQARALDDATLRAWLEKYAAAWETPRRNGRQALLRYA